MLFKKHKRQAAKLLGLNIEKADKQEEYFIDLDLMLKGSFCRRPSGEIRQYGVTVRGVTRIVTSGDFVDRTTYEALLAAGAVRPQHSPEEKDAATDAAQTPSPEPDPGGDAVSGDEDAGRSPVPSPEEME